MPMHARFRAPLPLALALFAAMAAPVAVTAQDLDGDGWTVADGDCADSPGGGITHPELVNPGAYDIPGNGIDDDCDGTVDNPAPTTCSATTNLAATATGLANALDICQTTTLNAPLAFRRWGLINAQLLQASGASAPAAVQTAVKSTFGNLVVPVVNATMALMSSGTARAANDPNYVAPTGGYDSGTPPVVAPVDFTGPNGGHYYLPQCPEPGDPVYDSVRLRLTIRVPTNADGFTFRHRFFSAEYPEQCTQYSDHFIALLTSTSPSIPPNKNILFDSQSNPVTVQTVTFEVCDGCANGDGDLAGTGYEGKAATAWLTSAAPVVPGEVITLEFHIWDSSDSQVDALGILDGFEWQFVTPTVDVVADGPPAALDLAVAPNPFRSTTAFRVALPEPAHVTVDVLDAMGRRVRRIANGGFAAGVSRLTWDGQTDAGVPARAGAYFVRMSAGDEQIVRRVVLRP